MIMKLMYVELINNYVILNDLINTYNLKMCTRVQGSHPTLKTWNFIINFSRPGKCLVFAEKVGKTLE